MKTRTKAQEYLLRLAPPPVKVWMAQKPSLDLKAQEIISLSRSDRVVESLLSNPKVFMEVQRTFVSKFESLNANDVRANTQKFKRNVGFMGALAHNWDANPFTLDRIANHVLKLCGDRELAKSNDGGIKELEQIGRAVLYNLNTMGETQRKLDSYLNSEAKPRVRSSPSPLSHEFFEQIFGGPNSGRSRPRSGVA